MTQAIFFTPKHTWENPRVKEWARGEIREVWTNNVDFARVEISTGILGLGGSYTVKIRGPWAKTIFDEYKTARANNTSLDLT